MTSTSTATADTTARWTEQRSSEWYGRQQWLVGANFLPSNGINQLEMWQADTFDPAEIDRELGWAQNIGMNTMRVFLHDLLWKQDRAGFVARVKQFLDLCDKHHIKVMFVLFDSCWDPSPRLGPQHPPIPGVHNSGWVQSPGKDALLDANQEPRLQEYVHGIVGEFANDPRVITWDVWNEPNNKNDASYGKAEPANKVERVEALLPKVFEWARSAHPTQPLTSGIWEGDWSSDATLNAVQKIQLGNSDVISFHCYGWPEDFVKRVNLLKRYNRPLFCTEYMARPVGNLFETILPIASANHVAAYNWGFVAGKSQTYMPWDSWQKPYVIEPPVVWFHDVFHADGTPYREAEVQLIHELSTNANAKK